MITEEPLRMGARVRDRDGDTWRKGRTRWTCEARVDGSRPTSIGRRRRARETTDRPVAVRDP
jgi:hypothetical protein